MLQPPPVGVELVARNEAGPDPARDRPKLARANQRADLVLRALKLFGKLVHRQRGRPFDTEVSPLSSGAGAGCPVWATGSPGSSWRRPDRPQP